MYRATHNLFAVMNITGHTTVSTTMKYQHQTLMAGRSGQPSSPVRTKRTQSVGRDSHRSCQVIEKDGERGRNRTFNLLIKSQLLCQLSYAPIAGGMICGGFHIESNMNRWAQTPATVAAITDRYSGTENRASSARRPCC